VCIPCPGGHAEYSGRVYQLIVEQEDEEREGTFSVPWHEKGRCTTQRAGRRVSSRLHSKVLDALLLDVGLLDHIWQPVRSASRLGDHRDAAREDVDPLGSTLS